MIEWCDMQQFCRGHLEQVLFILLLLLIVIAHRSRSLLFLLLVPMLQLFVPPFLLFALCSQQ